MIEIRKKTPAFTNGGTRFLDTANDHVLGYVCNDQVLVLANFSEHEQSIEGYVMASQTDFASGELVDLVGSQKITFTPHITLTPYRFIWLVVR